MPTFITMLTVIFGVHGRSLRRTDCGATATEYALLVGFIALVVVFGIAAFGTSLSAFWDSIAGTVGDLI